jgi:hypothetical protein
MFNLFDQNEKHIKRLMSVGPPSILLKTGKNTLSKLNLSGRLFIGKIKLSSRFSESKEPSP